ncbi:best-23 [Pristionchus pacificus]|uniref:Bestrophin homolog n=1 Tax=Pristionchus pacificus TaxID=54126 RepID=A0A2A6B9Q4_PRIPA|nr:best-23 [Pristionchus pacificus]|eukprot:PDM62609.1 best-23 [Pristionchus pacificus]
MFSCLCPAYAQGSLWKAIWKHLLLFIFLYYCINVVYRFFMTEEQQGIFLRYILIFDDFTKYIPLTFLLGFYVAMIVRRWWACCQLISWPDHLLFNISALIRGSDPETRIIRRTIARYAILTSVLAWRSISLRVLKRYPTDEHLVSSGLMTREELVIFKNIHVKVDPHQKWFVPVNWIQTMMVRCFEKGTLTHTNELRVLLDALEKFRNGFFQLFIYDWIAIPLVYTQVSTISVYGYFAFALIGRQYPSLNQFQQPVDIYFPVFTVLQFLFYVGWLKVGEDLMFPFGADDEDFEFNYILDRNLEVSFLIVDDLHNQVPPVYVESLKDEIELLHTKGSANLSNHPQRQHLRKYKMKDSEKKIYEHKNDHKVHPMTTSMRSDTHSACSFSDIEQAMLSPHNDHEGVRRFGRETEGALKAASAPAPPYLSFDTPGSQGRTALAAPGQDDGRPPRPSERQQRGLLTIDPPEIDFRPNSAPDPRLSTSLLCNPYPVKFLSKSLNSIEPR